MRLLGLTHLFLPWLLTLRPGPARLTVNRTVAAVSSSKSTVVPIGSLRALVALGPLDAGMNTEFVIVTLLTTGPGAAATLTLVVPWLAVSKALPG